MRPDLSSFNDIALFSEIASGNEEAFEVFFYRYNAKVYHFILHIVKTEEVAEELIHDVFLKLWLNRSSLAQVKSPDNYLFVAARNHSLNQLDKLATGRRQKFSLDNDEALADISDPEEQLLYKESLELIAQAVQELPEQQRLVFQLSNQQGLSREEIARRLNVSPHTVKNHLGSARKNIHQYMVDHGKIVGALLILHIFFGSR